MNRREFLATAGAAAAAGLMPGRVFGRLSPNHLTGLDGSALPALRGNRFLTFNSVIRVNQIEVRRDRNEGEDEVAVRTPEAVEDDAEPRAATQHTR